MIRDFSQDRCFVVEVESTSRCSFNCSFCNNRNELTHDDAHFDINFTNLARFIKKICKCTNEVKVLLNGGEPTMNDGLLGFCKSMKGIDYCTDELMTNLSASLELYSKLNLYARIAPSFHRDFISR